MGNSNFEERKDEQMEVVDQFQKLQNEIQPPKIDFPLKKPNYSLSNYLVDEKYELDKLLLHKETSNEIIISIIDKIFKENEYTQTNEFSHRIWRSGVGYGTHGEDLQYNLSSTTYDPSLYNPYDSNKLETQKNDNKNEIKDEKIEEVKEKEKEKEIKEEIKEENNSLESTENIPIPPPPPPFHINQKINNVNQLNEELQNSILVTQDEELDDYQDDYPEDDYNQEYDDYDYNYYEKAQSEGIVSSNNVKKEKHKFLMTSIHYFTNIIRLFKEENYQKKLIIDDNNTIDENNLTEKLLTNISIEKNNLKKSFGEIPSQILNGLCENLSNSKFFVYLVHLMDNDSIFEITSNIEFYSIIWDFLIEIIQMDQFKEFIEEKFHLLKLMKNFLFILEKYFNERVEKFKKIFNQQNENDETKFIRKIIGDKKLISNFISMDENNNEKSKNNNKEEENKEENNNENKGENNEKNNEKIEIETNRKEYKEKLTPFSFEFVPSFSTHFFHSKKSQTEISSLKLNRLIAEFQTLGEVLPTCISFDSSAFLKVDENDISFMKLLIIAPLDTPYENGCFEFDIFLPPEYPSIPPKVNLITTNNSTFRFNPNTYENGYVCLSLLGTWEGSNDERWDPVNSSILQLILSIQTLIFVNNPYYNEPGYEFSPQDDENNAYNERIRVGNVSYAMIDQISDEKSLFADVIKTHFLLKKNDIEKRFVEWNIDQNLIDKFNEKIKNISVE